MCAKCQTEEDLSIDCVQCGKTSHDFWEDPVGKFIDYLRAPRTFAEMIYVVSHNSRGYDAQFLLRRFLKQMETRVGNGWNQIYLHES
jgi:hypothetical protein